MQREGTGDQVLHKAAHRAALAIATAHDHHLIEGEVADGAGLGFHDGGQLLRNEQAGGGAGIASGSHNLAETGGLGFQRSLDGGGVTAAHKLQAFTLSLLLEEEGICLTLCQLGGGKTFSFLLNHQGVCLTLLLLHHDGGHGLCGNFLLALQDFSLHDFIGGLGGALELGALHFGLTVGDVASSFCLGSLFLFGHQGDTGGLCLAHLEAGIGIGHLHLGFVVAFHSGGIGHGHLHRLLTQGLSLADFASAGFLGHLNHGIIDSAGSGLLAKGGDIAGSIADIGDIGIDEVEAHLVQLHIHTAGDTLDEFFAVGVDFLDGEGSDHHTHLAHDDFGGEVADILAGAAQQAAGGILHDFRLGADAHNEGGRHIHTDILAGESPLERHVDIDGVQVHEGVALHHGHDEGGTAMNALGGTPGAHITVDNENFIGRAHLVAAEQPHDRAQEESHQNDDGHNIACCHRGCSYLDCAFNHNVSFLGCCLFRKGISP